ncbi:MAG TPA: circadian clock KaiB family protein [Bryobacteraceae bacterium]|nr:circadian clock KaiB family protein [Bryobacteraceae bacterium]
MPKLDALPSGRVSRSGPHRLRLYVAGSAARSLRAIDNVRRMCEAELSGRYRLEVVDIYKQPRRASEDQVVAIPTLIKEAPGLVRRMIGDMSETSLLRQGLGL